MFGRKKGGEPTPDIMAEKTSPLPEQYKGMDKKVGEMMEAQGFHLITSAGHGNGETTYVGRNDDSTAEIRITLRGLQDPAEIVNALKR